MRSLSRAEVRDVDRRAIEDFGLLGIVLMENAGRNAAALLHEMVPGASIAIACGKGNNAGDGFVMARHLENLGHDVRILLAGDPADHRGDAATNWRVIERAGIPCERLADGGAADWERSLAGAGCIVDALLGTGATGAPRGAIATAIESIDAVSRRQPVRVFAVDLPSGLDCDTGRPAGACVRADVTATFVARKIGFDLPATSEWTGDVRVLDIGVPRRLLVEMGLA
jgi:NAD(P)H-hydrate epimerase